jgi:GNAT superfamily N-acetyltransferase
LKIKFLNNQNLIIRDTRPEELDQVSLLLKDAYLQYQKNIPPEAFNPLLENIIDVRSRISEAELIVAELEGKIIGTVTLYLHPGKEQPWPEDWAGIRLLGVHPAYRNLGIGRALMEECIRRCKKVGIVTIGLHTTEAMSVAKRMYERMGFIRVPEFDFHPQPGVVVMAYRLDL